MISSDVVAWAMLLASPVFIFFGARLFKWALAGLGFVVTAVALQVILMKVGVWQTMSEPTAIVVLLLAGCAGAALLLGVWTAACFVIGGVTGVLLVNVCHQLIASQYGSGGEPGQIARIAVSAVVFVAFGMMTATAWKNALGRVLTSFVGAYMASAGVSHIGMQFGWWHDDSLCPIHGLFRSSQDFKCAAPECYALLGVWGVLFLCGWYFQQHFRQWEADQPLPLPAEPDDTSVGAADEQEVSPSDGAEHGASAVPAQSNSPPQHALNYPLPKAPAAPATSISVVTANARPVPTLAPAPQGRTKRPLLPLAHGAHFHHPLQHAGGSGSGMPSQQPPPQSQSSQYYQSGSGIGSDAVRPKPMRTHGRAASQTETDPLISATHAYGMNDT